MKAKPWTDEELIAANDVYHTMLRFQRTNVPYVKKRMVEDLMAGMDRSRPSIEFRMMNISAIRASLGLETVKGYAPMGNAGTKIRARLLPYIESYESVLRQLDAMESGDEYQMYKASQYEQEIGTA